MRFVLLVVLAAGRVAWADADADFREAARQLATSESRFISGWGTVKLDGAHPVRFATLMPHDGMGRGAYLIEQGPGAWWLVTFDVDGRTQAFEGSDTTTDDKRPWVEHANKQIDHAQGHHHGGESFAFALRGADLVVLAYHYSDDVSDPHDKPIARTFTRAAAPKLAGYYVRSADIAIAGPATSSAGLAEPKPQPLGVDVEGWQVKSDADALALWRMLVTNSDDVDKLFLIGDGPVAKQLALAVVRGGNFTCPAAPESARCGLRHALATPAFAATFDDRCVRRGATLWALQFLAQHDDVVAQIADSLRTIAALPAPERELVDAAIELAAADPVLQHELAVLAWRAGHHDSHAVDRALATATDATLANLIGDPAKSARAGDCASAAIAAIVRERAGDHSLVPARPSSRDPAAMTRQLCILAHYSELGGEKAQLGDFIAASGFDIEARATTNVPFEGAQLPDAIVTARCVGTTCTTDDEVLRFSYARDRSQLLLSKIAFVDRPRCR